MILDASVVSDRICSQMVATFLYHQASYVKYVTTQQGGEAYSTCFTLQSRAKRLCLFGRDLKYVLSNHML